MAGKRFTTVTKQGRRKDVTNYGTMDSDSLSGAESSGSHQEAGKRTSKRYRCILYTTIVLFISFALIWILSSLNNQDETTVGSLFPPMLHHRRPEKDPQYLWVVEHDSNAHNTSLATRRSLYAQDKLTTKTSDDCASTMDTWTWILDRASYADTYLDDIFQDPGFYSAVLEADLIFCEQAGFAGVPTSRSAQYRLVGNSYFSRSPSRSWWPLLKAFDVAVDFNLAIRPQFQGKRRVIPCTCQATNTGTPDITVTVHKSSLSLSFECSNLFDLNPEGSVLRENEHAPISAGRGGYAMIGATAPGFYVIPDLPLPEHQSDRKRIQSGDSIKNKATQSSFYTPESATQAMGIPESPDRHVACTLSRALWARYCHGNLRRWHAAVLSMSTSHGILRRAPAATDPDPPKHPLAGLFVALGMLVLFSGLALAGTLIRRHLEKRARLGVARAASLEELGAASADELDTRPRYVRLLQRIQIMFAWADWVADRFNQKQSQAFELNKVKEGGGPRKLQKTKGTRFEDPTDLRPQVMPPASEIPIGRPIDQRFDIEKRPDDRIGDNMDQGSAEYLEGISTAQEHRSRNAAIRRSNRSTGVPDGHEENL